MSTEWSWPASDAGGVLGDGRFAVATDRPRTPEELAEAVRARAAEGLAIYPQGGCTALDYGGVPSRPGVAMSTLGLDRVVDYPHADMTITVEAGMTLAALSAVLAGQGQRLPLDPPEPERATIGGILATQASGPRRFGLGRPRDLIIGVTFASSRGELIKGGGRVVKNVAGYDFPKLLTGSMGTLGVIVQATLKVRPIPETAALVWTPLADAGAVASALERLNVSLTRPVALELLSEPAAREIAGSIDLPIDRYVLVAGFEDNPDSIAWQLEQIRLELDPNDRAEIQGQDCEPLWRALADFQASRIGPFSIQANLCPHSVPGFLDQLDPARMSARAHAGDGIVHAHAIGDWSFEETAAAVSRLQQLAAAEEGYLIVTRCPTDWKSRISVWGLPRADWPLARKVKATLDPLHALNPGRFVDSIETTAGMQTQSASL